ncbi:MFS transporter [Lyticum sinuosum]|nr:MFS transporter [Lyticum sinuosum]
MQTIKAYLEDTYCFAGHGEVIHTGMDDKGHFFILDKTIFYPQGGGQPSDQGYLEIDTRTEHMLDSSGYRTTIDASRDFEGDSQQEQSSKLGLLNGFVTCGMALAPIIGSYLNIYLGWRGGFIFLITLGALCLLMSQLFIPNDYKRNDQVSFSVLEYSKIINSRLFWVLAIMVCFLCLHYWIFIGMSPIIYMQGMGLTLNQFGLYQGVIAASFASMSFLSPMLLRKLNHFNCVKISLFLHIIFSSVLLIVMTFSPMNYILITILMCFCTVSSVLPVNVIYPKILSSFNGSESKAASLVNIVRLIGTAIGIEVVSYFYVGRTLELGCVLFLLSTLVLVVFFNPYFRNAFNNKKLQGND